MLLQLTQLRRPFVIRSGSALPSLGDQCCIRRCGIFAVHDGGSQPERLYPAVLHNLTLLPDVSFADDLTRQDLFPAHQIDGSMFSHPQRLADKEKEVLRIEVHLHEVAILRMHAAVERARAASTTGATLDALFKDRLADNVVRRWLCRYLAHHQAVVKATLVELEEEVSRQCGMCYSRTKLHAVPDLPTRDAWACFHFLLLKSGRYPNVHTLAAVVRPTQAGKQVISSVGAEEELTESISGNNDL